MTVAWPAFRSTARSGIRRAAAAMRSPSCEARRRASCQRSRVEAQGPPPSLWCWQAANWTRCQHFEQTVTAPQTAEQQVLATAMSVAARQAGQPLRLRLEGAPQGGELRLQVVDALHQRTLRRVVAIVRSSAPSPGLDLLARREAALDKARGRGLGTQRALIFISFTSGCGIWYPAKMTLSSECSCLCLAVCTRDA